MLHVHIAFLFSGSSFFINYYSWNTAYDHIDNVQCSGTEAKLIDCPHSIANLGFYRSARVDCTYGKCVHKAVS